MSIRCKLGFHGWIETDRVLRYGEIKQKVMCVRCEKEDSVVWENK